ncbi:hypothetical protein L798_15503 [Zootermopsis nevadensis]|uniref:Uncharacterized protein n=1 Tax=Zootermopsis nevadensis TaxID=136037 RepID=A0A067QPP0_ZOONE|nr:hypothetical protein L798_15503 [Zootermopsis nevadensis]
MRHDIHVCNLSTPFVYLMSSVCLVSTPLSAALKLREVALSTSYNASILLLQEFIVLGRLFLLQETHWPTTSLVDCQDVASFVGGQLGQVHRAACGHMHSY